MLFIFSLVRCIKYVLLINAYKKESIIYIKKEVIAINQDEIAKILKRAGWTDTGRGKGSHRVFVSPDGKKVTTVPKPKGPTFPKEH
jgi:predicted RNA binding protein YcfA (HicA-like mRNA interferase family)